MDLPIRPRRNRKSAAVRGMVRETRLSPENFIYPLFLSGTAADEDIASMPGCKRWSQAGLLKEIGKASAAGVKAVVLFPRIPESFKSPEAGEACNPDGLVPQTVREIKATHPDVAVITDIALDPYNSDGHDGLVAYDGRILNDETVEVLCR